MRLVDYSDSDSNEEDPEPRSKKRRLTSGGTGAATLPPLPPTFRDLYSSTVRTSTSDDPALHGGRKRVTPHIPGNWPAHVFLDWFPHSEAYTCLSTICSGLRGTDGGGEIHSLLENDLGVRLPLHISLSRPLALKTEQKDGFLCDLQTSIAKSDARAFNATPLDLVWHPNEERTRWFLVLRLQRPAGDGDDLRSLLNICNGVAGRFRQPLLYTESTSENTDDAHDAKTEVHDSFHISLAWSLHPAESDLESVPVPVQKANDSSTMLEQVKKLRVPFAEVKVRIGQDVFSIPLQKPRKR